MGKKRRLKSAKAKFGAKHSNHPRMLLLNSVEAPEVEVVAPKPEPEVVPPEPEPEVVLQEEKVEIKPKPTPKPKTAKKPKRTTRKRTTKKAAQAIT
jgi:outer membrane biosynthesis protein TonB